MKPFLKLLYSHLLLSSSLLIAPSPLQLRISSFAIFTGYRLYFFVVVVFTTAAFITHLYPKKIQTTLPSDKPLSFAVLHCHFFFVFFRFVYFTRTKKSKMAGLQKSFEAFASFGSAPTKEMDNSHFSKMLKECKIIGKSFTSTDADLLFNKVKAKGARKMTFDDFKSRAIPEIAAKMKKSPEEVEAMVENSSPEARATKADNVKFHDDKSMYTGVYKQGGPTNVDRNAGSLAGVVDRRVSEVDVRGTTATQK